MLENSAYTIELDTFINYITDGSYSGMKLTLNGDGIAIEVITTPFIQQRVKKMLTGEGIKQETVNSLTAFKTFMNYNVDSGNMVFTTVAKTKVKDGETPASIRAVYRINEKSKAKALESLEKICQEKEGVSLNEMYEFLLEKEDSVLYKVAIASIREVICQYWDRDKTYIELPDVATIKGIIEDIKENRSMMEYVESIKSLVDKHGNPIKEEWNAMFDHTVRNFAQFIDEKYISIEE